MEPLVSIIIPTYNRVSFLGETLDCILEQEYKNWECIVVDDRSEDSTIEFLAFYHDKDSRIRFFKRPADYPSGANSCRNIGFSNSQGKYIQWLDSDDVISPNKISSQISLLEISDADIATSLWGRFKNNISEYQMQDMTTYKDFESTKLFIDELGNDLGYFPVHAYLIRRTIIEKAGPWLEGLTVNQDGEFMMRVIANSKRIKFCEDGFALYRRSQHSSTSQYNEEKIKDLINSWKIIEGYLFVYYKDSDLPIIRKAKESIFSVSKIWPGVIRDNRDFFYGIKENNAKGKIKGVLKQFLLRFKLF